MRIQVFQDMTPCGWEGVSSARRFVRT